MTIEQEIFQFITFALVIGIAGYSLYLHCRIKDIEREIRKIKFDEILKLRRDVDKNIIRTKCMENDIKALQKGECETCRFIKEHRQADEEYLFFGHKVRYCPECGADTEEDVEQ